MTNAEKVDCIERKKHALIDGTAKPKTKLQELMS